MRSVGLIRGSVRGRKSQWTLIFLAIVSSWSRAAAGEEGQERLLSEVRVGVHYHDAGVIVSAGERDQNRVESPSFDINLELLFQPLGTLDVVGSPRPHIGVTVNTSGETSQAYAGLTWTWTPSDRFIFELGGGAAVHNGQTDGPALDPNEPFTAANGQKLLGCRVLFRGAVALGVRLNTRHSVTLAFDHISNGYLCEPNPGLDTLGLRWGYRF